MKRFPILAALAMVLLLQPWQASAQTWSPQQQEVWAAVQAQWHAPMAREIRSMQRFLHPDYRGRTTGATDPCDDESAGWAGYGMESVSSVVHDLVPVEIVFRGNTAVVHYQYYSPSRTNREGKQLTLPFRYTDTLVKENDRWRFRALDGEDSDAVP